MKLADLQTALVALVDVNEVHVIAIELRIASRVDI
jgi:hypothetical protein